MNYHITPFELGLSVEIAAGATVNASAEFTQDSPMMPIPIYQPGFSQAMPVPIATTIASLGSITASTTGSISDYPVAAVRLTINSGTSPATLVVRQAGIRN
jgi:hypothetical protein